MTLRCPSCSHGSAADFSLFVLWKVGVPAKGIFPQRLERGLTWLKYLNYIYRQLYVLDTYVDTHNRRLNLVLLAVHSYASLSVALGSLSFLFSSSRSTLFFITLLLAQSSLYLMTHQVLCLLHTLANPHISSQTNPNSPDLANRSQSITNQIPISRFNWFKVWLGLFIESSLVPSLALIALTTPLVDWGGIKYRKLNGKVKRSTE